MPSLALLADELGYFETAAETLGEDAERTEGRQPRRQLLSSGVVWRRRVCGSLGTAAAADVVAVGGAVDAVGVVAVGVVAVVAVGVVGVAVGVAVGAVGVAVGVVGVVGSVSSVDAVGEYFDVELQHYCYGSEAWVENQKGKVGGSEGPVVVVAVVGVDDGYGFDVSRVDAHFAVESG